MRRALAAALLLAGCHHAAAAPDSPGARLEAAAVARGLVADPARASLVGVWASDSDRLCVVPARDGFRIGAGVDYGDGQACAAAGTMTRQGDRLRVRLGSCAFEARFEGDRIAFPGELPAACAAACDGRASLAALSAARLSESQSEAETMRGPGGRLLCGG